MFKECFEKKKKKKKKKEKKMLIWRYCTFEDKPVLLFL